MKGRARSVTVCPQCGSTAGARGARWCGECGSPLYEEPSRTDDDAPAETASEEEPASPAARLVAAGALVAVIGGLLLAGALTEPEAVPAGHSARGDSARSGIVSAVDVAEPLGEVWRDEVPTPPLLPLGSRILGTSQTPEGELLTVLTPGAQRHRIAVHEIDDGSLRWTTTLPLGSQPWRTEVNRDLLAHRTLREVTLLELSTATRLWSLEISMKGPLAVVPQGVVSVPAEASGEDTLVLLSREDGTELWRVTLESTQRFEELLPVVAEDGRDVLVVVGQDSFGGRFATGLDAATGARLWALGGSELSTQQSFPSARLVSDGRRLLDVSATRIGIIDGGTGELELRDPPTTAVPVQAQLAGDLVLVLDGTGTLIAFDEAGELWRLPLGLEPPVLSLRTTDTTALLTTDVGLITVDLATGDVVRQSPLDLRSGSAVVAAGDLVVQLGPDAVLRASGPDGAAWDAPTIATPTPDLVTDGGVLAVSVPTGVQTRDVADGVRRWTHDAFDEALVNAGDLTSPTVLAGRVTVAPPEVQPPERGGLLSLFADTGIVEWARRDDRVAPRGTAVVDRDLLVIPVGTQVLGFDRTSGVRRLVVETNLPRGDVAAAGDWLAAVDHPLDAGNLWVGRRSDRRTIFTSPIRSCAPPVLTEETVMVLSDDGDLFARFLADGSAAWSKRTGGSSCRPLSLLEDVVVVVDDDRELVGMDLGTGDTVWRRTLDSHLAAAPVVAGDHLLVVTLDGRLSAIDPGLDEPVWSFDLGDVASGPPAVDGDTIVVQLRSGQLLALR